MATGHKVVHRIVGGDGTTGFTMRGDNNSFLDPWKPRPRDVLGRVVLMRPINLGILYGSLTVTALLWPGADGAATKGEREPEGRASRPATTARGNGATGANAASPNLWTRVRT